MGYVGCTRDCAAEPANGAPAVNTVNGIGMLPGTLGVPENGGPDGPRSSTLPTANDATGHRADSQPCTIAAPARSRQPEYRSLPPDREITIVSCRIAMAQIPGAVQIAATALPGNARSVRPSHCTGTAHDSDPLLMITSARASSSSSSTAASATMKSPATAILPRDRLVTAVPGSLRQIAHADKLCAINSSQASAGGGVTESPSLRGEAGNDAWDRNRTHNRFCVWLGQIHELVHDPPDYLRRFAWQVGDSSTDRRGTLR